MALADLGMDPRVAAVLEDQGIQELYPPQVEAWQALRGGGNVLVAVPTASGKSLVAYLAILHRWLATGKKALYIVPLRALASEKHEELQAFKELGLKVGLATGDLDERDPRLGRFDVIVCTSEKADSLLRHRTSWVDDIGCVVADELHLIHEPKRGPTLEVILSRFRGLLPDAQIVGLSATVTNAAQVARWLGADLVHSTWRPVDLRLATYHGNALEFWQPHGEKRELEAGGDPVVGLVEDAIDQGGQALVFVSTRRSAEAQAKRLAGPVAAKLNAEELAALEEAVGELAKGSGDDVPSNVKALQLLVKRGASYHTAGLDSAQRRFIEDAFRRGLIKVLCATPTLAAGVNTPARRVIIRDLRRFEAGYGNVPLPVMEVQQMMGRAGRPRYDPYGEAVLLAKSAEERDAIVETYLLGESEPVTSKLAGEGPLRIHTLASIAGGYCATFAELRAWLESTFWAAETDTWILEERLEDVLWFLEDNGFVERDGGQLRATLFGKRTSDLYIDPASALRLREALGSARPKATDMGLLTAVAGCPEVFPLYLRKADDWVQERYWELEGEWLVDDRDMEAAMSFAKTALLLRDWMNEVPQRDMEERYQIGPGDVRLRLDTARWLVHAFRELARAFRADWQAHLAEIGVRLESGVKKELLPLLKLRNVGRVRARTLHAAGFHTPDALKGAPVARLAALAGVGDRIARDLLRQVGDDPDVAPKEQPPAPKANPDEDDGAPPTPDNGQASLAQWGGA
ncbi:MAG: DEAD/DEAH box helicase [Thermoplasmatota archaeon]